MKLPRANIHSIIGFLCIILAFSYTYYNYSIHESSLVVQETTKKIEPAAEPTSSEIIKSEPQADEDKGPFELTLKIQEGDTLMSILIDAQIDKKEAYEVTEILKKHFNPKDLKPHHEIYVSYFKDDKNKTVKLIESLYFRPSIDKEFWIKSNENNEFVFEKNDIKLNQVFHEARGIIHDSLYRDAGKNSVPKKILHQMIQAFSYDVDFQRSFHEGDEYGLLYTMKADEEGLREEPGELLYAFLNLSGKKIHLYNYHTKSGNGFYNSQGESIKKGLLRTPIDGARISSKFGNRKHPILGYTKAHKGIDFAAPLGTPIMASGDGMIAQVGPYGSYGNYVKIIHTSELSTAYAHLSRFIKGLKVGKFIKQGQIIGYVGSTGSSTGPHLHYELIRHNVQINPASIQMMPTAKLGGQELESFKKAKASLDQKYHEVYMAKMKKVEANEQIEDDQNDEYDEENYEDIKEDVLS